MKRAHISSSMSKFSFWYYSQHHFRISSSLSSSTSTLIFCKHVLDFPFNLSSKYPAKYLPHMRRGWLCEGSSILKILASLRHCNYVDKTKYMIMSRDKNAGRSYSMKTDNSSIERVEQFKYLGTALTNKNSIYYNIARRSVWVWNLVADTQGGS